MAVHILGIRHHGVGSADHVLKRLGEIKPDLILVEGPPEISELLSLVGNPDFVPPVAIMLYNEKNVTHSIFYPYAEFSPEWIAAKYASENKVPISAIDLPASIAFTIRKGEGDLLSGQNQDEEDIDEDVNENIEIVNHIDPLSYLAKVSKFSSGEAWWDHQFEHISDNASALEQFDATMECMQALRESDVPSALDSENVVREAYMRHLIRYHQTQMYADIAVICGAWHGPSLLDIDKYEKEDKKLIKNLPKSKIKISSSWIPWTNGRLGRQSGYGAGIVNPGWYEHQWYQREDMEMKWLIKAALAFREEGIDVSSAHILESYALSHSMAKLRGHSRISYTDLNDSIQTVMCDGEKIVYELINRKLNVDEKIGTIPSDLGNVPLHQDFSSLVKSLRLKLSAMPKSLDLDLRKPMDLKRSIFFHRLEILGIGWASKKTARTKGTFKEKWDLVWIPEMEIQIIERAHYGNSILTATESYVQSIIVNEKRISFLIQLIQDTIPAELFACVNSLLAKINDETTISNDIKDLMKGLPSLIHISRYGDVRNTDAQEISKLCNRLFQKISIGISSACYGLDEDNSNEMFELISQLDKSLKLLKSDSIQTTWQSNLRDIMDKDGVNMVIKGCTIRLLFDKDAISQEELSKCLLFYLSSNQDAFDVAYWIEGFLRGSGLILLYDHKIWNQLYQWVDGIGYDSFLELLPVLRRAFSKFPFGERRRIGEKAKSGIVLESQTVESHTSDFDHDRAIQIIPFIEKYL